MHNQKEYCQKEIVYSYKQIKKVAADVASMVKDAAIITFSGPLGAGKTTLISELAHALGITQSVSSPTYTYVNVYKNREGKTFYHFDLYRISSIDDFIAFGFNEYLYEPNSVALIEWPDVIAPLLKEKVCAITIEYLPDMLLRKLLVSF